MSNTWLTCAGTACPTKANTAMHQLLAYHQAAGTHCEARYHSKMLWQVLRQILPGRTHCDCSVSLCCSFWRAADTRGCSPVCAGSSMPLATVPSGCIPGWACGNPKTSNWGVRESHQRFLNVDGAGHCALGCRPGWACGNAHACTYLYRDYDIFLSNT